MNISSILHRCRYFTKGLTLRRQGTNRELCSAYSRFLIHRLVSHGWVGLEPAPLVSRSHPQSSGSYFTFSSVLLRILPFSAILTVIMQTFLSGSLALTDHTTFALPFELFSCSCCGQKRWRCWCVEVQNLIWALCRRALNMTATIRRTPPYGEILLLPVHHLQLTCPGPQTWVCFTLCNT